MFTIPEGYHRWRTSIPGSLPCRVPSPILRQRRIAQDPNIAQKLRLILHTDDAEVRLRTLLVPLPKKLKFDTIRPRLFDVLPLCYFTFWGLLNGAML